MTKYIPWYWILFTVLAVGTNLALAPFLSDGWSIVVGFTLGGIAGWAGISLDFDRWRKNGNW